MIINREGRNLDVTGNLMRERIQVRAEDRAKGPRPQRPGLDVADEQPCLLGWVPSIRGLPSKTLWYERQRQMGVTSWWPRSLEAEEGRKTLCVHKKGGGGGLLNNRFFSGGCVPGAQEGDSRGRRQMTNP